MNQLIDYILLLQNVMY